MRSVAAWHSPLPSRDKNERESFPRFAPLVRSLKFIRICTCTDSRDVSVEENDADDVDETNAWMKVGSRVSRGNLIKHVPETGAARYSRHVRRANLLHGASALRL